MKRCPNCGTINPDNTTRCNQCGSALQPKGIRCPKCGTLNPIGQMACTQCNARLPVPAQEPHPGIPGPRTEQIAPSAVKGFSVPEPPAVEQEAPEDLELPDWLRRLMDETPDAGESSTVGEDTNSESPLPQGDMPDWLAKLMDEQALSDAPQTSTEEPATAVLPSWMNGLETPAPKPAARAESAEDDAWMAQLLGTSAGDIDTSEDAPPAAEEPTPIEERAAESLPDWLSGWEEEAASRRQGAYPTPEPVGDEAMPGSETAQQGEGSEQELPDWLLVPTQGSAGTDAAEETPELPGWLVTSTAELPTPGGIAPELPAWLEDEVRAEAGESEKDRLEEPALEMDSIESAESREPAGSSVAAADAGSPQVEIDQPVGGTDLGDEIAIPDWLATLLQKEPSASAQPSDQLPGTGELLPEWLRETAPAAEAVEAPAELMDEVEGLSLPDWLTTAEVESTAAPEAVGAPDMELPAWMDALLGTATEADAVSSPQAAAELPEALPDWLAELGGGSSEGAGIIAAAERDMREAEEAEPEPAEPGWLADVTLPRGIGESSRAVPAFVDGAGEAPDAALLQEVPGGPPEASQEEAPDWLTQLASPAVAETEREASSLLPEVESEGLARAEVPIWLQNLRPPGAELLSSAEEEGLAAASAAVPGTTGDLLEAEIPEWVQALRPQTGEVGGDVAEAMARWEPPEEVGPLAGIPKVLPALSLLDLPGEHKPTLEHLVPEGVLKQAQLWQELLAQPRGAERPIGRTPQRRHMSPTVLRLVLAVMLTLGVLGAFLFLPEELQLAQAPSVETRPWIADLDQAIEALPEGERVLVAVDYGPGDAIEMEPIAEAILEHLVSQQTELTVVSSLPEGTALIPGLLAQAAVVNMTLPERPTYVPGEVNGIASFLGQASEEGITHVIVLSSRADRLQWWIEQSTLAGLPISIGTGATAGPWVKPYLEGEQTRGGLIGYAELQTYQGLRNVEVAGAARILDVLMLSHWMAFGFLVLGFLYCLIAGKKGSG